MKQLKGIIWDLFYKNSPCSALKNICTARHLDTRILLLQLVALKTVMFSSCPGYDKCQTTLHIFCLKKTNYSDDSTQTFIMMSCKKNNRLNENCNKTVNSCWKFIKLWQTAFSSFLLVINIQFKLNSLCCQLLS